MRRTITTALREAGRLGRDAAGPEHLVLAICADPDGGGACLLRRCGWDLSQAAARIRAVEPADLAMKARADSLDASALQLLDEAGSLAQRLGADCVGSEHVVLAIPSLKGAAAGGLFAQMGLTAPAVQDAWRLWTRQGMPTGGGRLGNNPILASLRLHKLNKVLKFPAIAWKIYGRKSLGHPGFVRDPYPLYRWLRTHDPVRKDPLAPVWILTRYDDAATMLRDSRFRKDPFATERLPTAVRRQLGAPERVDAEAVSMLFLDPPQHTRVRSNFARAFTPASLAALRPRIELICQKRLDRVHASGRMELIGDLAYPLPVFVIAEMLGFPPEDYEKFKRWSDEMTASLALNATAQQHAVAGEARNQIREYFFDVVLPMKNRPADSLISRLLETEDQPGGLSREELFTNSVLLLAAGHETTTNLIGNGIVALMRNRDQWEQLVAERSLVESAVEEMLRYDSPVQWASRLIGEEMEFAGKSLDAGMVVLGCIGAANRDPTRFKDPERFDIRRADNKHLSFGTGIHFCLGAALARMEAQIVLSMLLERYPKMKWTGAKLEWMKGLTFRGIKRLPLALR
ncbi:MAG: cytochrome P450 [Tepidisphaeraceae bacterium]|jgi:cytochrome P450